MKLIAAFFAGALTMGVLAYFAKQDNLDACLERSAKSALTNDAFRSLAVRCHDRYDEMAPPLKLKPFNGELKDK